MLVKGLVLFSLLVIHNNMDGCYYFKHIITRKSRKTRSAYIYSFIK